MSIVATSLKVFGALLLVMASTAAHANQVCGSRSPLYDSMGDQYFYLDAHPIGAPLVRDVNPDFLFEAMQEHSLVRGYGDPSAGMTMSRELYINGDLAEWIDWALIR